MDFAFSSDQQLLKNSARAFLDEHVKPAQVRLLWDDGRGESEALWKEMAQLGWLGLALPEDAGGSALGLVETAILQEELGRAACPSPYLPTVLAAMAIDRFGTPAQKHRWLPAVAAGSARATVALMERALDWGPASVETHAEERGGKVALSGVKQFVPWAHVADVILVPARRGGSTVVYAVEAGAPGVAVTPLTGMDPGTRLAQVRLDGAAVAAEAALPAEAYDFLLQRGAVGAAAEMLGAARRCLDMSVEYAKVREQFGQPIGSFQAIRHKCADMLLDVENSHAAVYYAAWALASGADDGALAASVAKAYVNDAARKVCGDAIQVHGGIGFTWEYDLHLYFKRAKALEPLYGDAEHHRELIVRRVAR
ncbi:MAG TPA: acyl-CoA dehydrogenase family protein [Methylomirabilota bacterium]|jgi:alkylation response protein AidB-like acyl-CoA dehydrogenase|nr:acyl-CoA dehydrogenase family protein [Methylomirabilota bacterium]